MGDGHGVNWIAPRSRLWDQGAMIDLCQGRRLAGGMTPCSQKLRSTAS